MIQANVIVATANRIRAVVGWLTLRLLAVRDGVGRRLVVGCLLLATAAVVPPAALAQHSQPKPAPVSTALDAADWRQIRAALAPTALAVDSNLSQEAYLKASNTDALDTLGRSVAVSGDTVVIGASGEASASGADQSDDSIGGAGAAYVFVRSGATWSQQAYLKASNPDAGDNFGHSVAIDGDTIVVGAFGEDGSGTTVDSAGADDSATNAGAAYVFVRSGTSWSQQASLKASNAEAMDQFGYSVDISSDTVIVGAYQEDSSSTGVGGTQANNSAAEAGAAYVFSRSGTTWSQQAYLKASNTDSDDQFGWSVSVSGDSAVVGAYQEDGSATTVNGADDDAAANAGAAYVFTRSGTTWSQQAYLKATNGEALDQLGWSVAIDVDTVIVGATGEDSDATGVDGDAADDSLAAAGAAYVFFRSGMAWSQQAYLKGSSPDITDAFGYSVAVSGDGVVVGSHQEDSAATGIGGDATNDSAADSGAAFTFARDGSAWSSLEYLKASNAAAGDKFGYSVAIADELVVVGAFQEDSAATVVNGDQASNAAADSGAGYIYGDLDLDPDPSYAKASNTGAGDAFGWSVAVSGNTAVVGAYLEDSSATGVDGDESDNSSADSGAAYVFVRDGDTWAQQAYLKASNTDAGDLFGRAVAISGDTVVVGAQHEDSIATGVNGSQTDHVSAVDSGAAYVFVRSGTTWSQQAYLKASNTGATDNFGYAVATDGDTIVVGSYGEDGSATGVDGSSNDAAVDSGAAYVFTRTGTTWSQQAYLKASNTGAEDQFGYAVGVSGDTVVVSARFEDSSATGIDGDQASNSALQAGAAYVFARSGTTWSQQAYLKASNTNGGDQFGNSAGVSGDVVVVGAPYEGSSATGVNGDGANNAAPVSGAAYVFNRSGMTWSQQAYVKSSNTASEDAFGWAVAVSAETVVVGATGEDSAATGIGGDQAGNAAPGSGAAYLFRRSSSTWSQQAYLKASNTGAGDLFGRAVAVNDTVVIGAPNEDSASNGIGGEQSDESATDSGAAYFYAAMAGVAPPANMAPAGTDNTVTTAQDTPYTFASADFGFNDGDGHSLLAVKVTTLPAEGSLENDGTPVNAGDSIGAMDIDAGKLVFTPDAGESGEPYTSFTFQVQDDGGTADDGVDLDQSPNTMTINVDDVAPTLTLIKDPTNDSGGSAAPDDFALTIGGNAATSGHAYTLIANTAYAINETQAAGYDFVSITGDPECPALLGGTVTLDEGEDVTCTITNDDIAPTLTVIKHVINDDGGTAVAADWTMDVTATNPSNNNFAGSESPGTTITLDAGSYSVSESNGPSGYSLSSSAECSGTAVLGGSYTCTLTNDDQAASLTIIKHVINDNGGTADAVDWQMDVSGSSPSDTGFDGEESPGVTISINAGPYTVTESGGPSGYSLSSSADCSTTAVVGGSYTCTLTNDDIAPTLTVIKHVINDNGGDAEAADWTMDVTATNPSDASFDGGESPGVTITIDAGSYSVAESGGPSGYSLSSSAECSGTAALGGSYTCMLTNDDQAASLTIIKHVINDDGGGATAADWTMNVSGSNPSSTGFDGSESPGTTISIDAGPYTVTESGGPSGYDDSYSADCATTAVNGGSYTCTITNDDVAPTLKLVKSVITDDGGDEGADNWTLYASAGVMTSGQVDAGLNQTCAVHPAGQLECWGYDNYGQVSGPNASSATFSQVSAGWFDICALRSDGQLECWGYDNYGQVSGPNAGTDTYTQVSAGFGYHTCALRSDGQLDCWGHDNAGQVAGPNASTDTFSQVSAGVLQTCALRTDGQLECWGYNGNGQVSGPNASTDTFSQVSTGGEYACAVHTDGELECWGMDDYGQVSGPNASTDTFSQVSAGYNHTCALRTDGELECWGDDPFGQVSGPNASTGTFIQVSAGLGHTCALRPDRQLDCWGYNGYGEVSGPNASTDAYGTSIGSDASRNFGNAGDADTFEIVYANTEYVLYESSVLGYSAGGWDCDGGSLVGSTLTLAPDEHVTCTITNDDIAPTLKLIKYVTTDDGGDEVGDDWTLSATAGAPFDDRDFSNLGGSGDFETVFANTTYVLDESSVPGYAAGEWGWECDGGSQGDGTITLAEGQNVTCTITNDDIAPTLTLIKDPTNDSGGTAAPDDFSLTIGGNTALSGVAYTLDANTPYAIDESQLAGYEFVSITGDPECPGLLGGTVTLDEGENVTCTITNDDIVPNSAPAGTDNTVTTAQDTPYTFASADFGFGDGDGDSLLAVKVTTLPGQGALENDGTAVNAGDSISATDIDAGKLVFTPDAGESGTSYTAFSFQVQDDGGTEAGGADLDPDPNTMTIDVTPAPPPDDDTPPVTTNVAVVLYEGGQIDSVSVEVSWSAYDETTDDADLLHQVQRRRWRFGWRSWQDIATVTGTESIYQVALWRRFQYRVRTQDEAGNWSAWAYSDSIKFVRRDDNQFRRSAGDWTRISVPGSMRGEVSQSSTVGAWARLKFRGNGVALVMPANASQGTVEVCLDPGTLGEDCRTIDLGAFSPTGNRRLVAAFVGLPHGVHFLRVTVLGGTVNLDGAIYSHTEWH